MVFFSSHTLQFTKELSRILSDLIKLRMQPHLDSRSERSHVKLSGFIIRLGKGELTGGDDPQERSERTVVRGGTVYSQLKLGSLGLFHREKTFMDSICQVQVHTVMFIGNTMLPPGGNMHIHMLATHE